MSDSAPSLGEFFDLLKLVGEHVLDCFTIVDMDADRRCLFVNERFIAKTGFSNEQAEGRNLSFLQGPETSTQVVDYIRQSLDAGLACCADILNYKSDGSPFMNRLVMLPIKRDGEAYFLGFQNVIEDVDAEQQALPDVSHGEISHVLNNQLAGLVGDAEIALMAETDPNVVLGSCSERLSSINNYCRRIHEPNADIGYNPFR